MIYTKMTKLAMHLAYEAHKNQYDKSNMPYIFHPFYLATQMDDEDSTCVALLHDIIEDTPLTHKDLQIFGFNDDVMKALSYLTHDKSIDYMDYVENIKNNPIARKVKIADLRHNSDLTRLDRIDKRDLKRVEKYKKAIAILED